MCRPRTVDHSKTPPSWQPGYVKAYRSKLKEAKKVGNERYKSDESLVRCKCLRCESEGRDPWHMVRMDWRGRGYPRVYCPVCGGQVNNMGMLPHLNL